MIIANPIYDVVFKYLLEDVEIARELLATILGEEVQSLEMKPQETSTETAGDIRILRFDFKAVEHQVDFQGDTSDPLIKKMVERLGRAIASEEIRDKMDVEDELDRIFEREMSKKEEIIAEKEEIIAEKDKLLSEEKKRAEEEKKRAEEEIQKNLELQRQIEELKRQLKP
jgi:hypothetical protein